MPEAVREVPLSNTYGLHARPASRIVGLAARYKAAITLANGKGRAVNAKSIMEVLTLGATKGAVLTIRAQGEDAEAAVAEITALIVSGFGPEEGAV